MDAFLHLIAKNNSVNISYRGCRSITAIIKHKKWNVVNITLFIWFYFFDIAVAFHIQILLDQSLCVK